MRRGRGRGINWRSRGLERGLLGYPPALNMRGFLYGRGLGYRYLRSRYATPVYPSSWWTGPVYGNRLPYAWSYPGYSYQRALNPSYGYW